MPSLHSVFPFGIRGPGWARLAGADRSIIGLSPPSCTTLATRAYAAFMKMRSWFTRLLILAACLTFGVLAAQPAQAQAADTIMGLRLNGVVDPFVADYLRGSIQDANHDGNPAILLQIDTPGGLDSSMRTITQAILNSTVPVICYTAPSRCARRVGRDVRRHPLPARTPWRTGTNIGAAHPVGV